MKRKGQQQGGMDEHDGSGRRAVEEEQGCMGGGDFTLLPVYYEEPIVLSTVIRGDESAIQLC